MNSHQSLKCLFSAPLKTQPSFLPHIRSCNLVDTHRDTCVYQRFTQKITGFQLHIPLCLTFLQPVHNLQPDDVTFMKAEHGTVVRHKVTLRNHIFWVLKGTSISYHYIYILKLVSDSRVCKNIKAQVRDRVNGCAHIYLFDLTDEGVDEMFDLRCLGWEEDEFLICQIKLQHVFRWDGYKQDVCIATKTVLKERSLKHE